VSSFRAWTLVEGAFREGANVPVTDRGFRYGMSIFETLAVHRGRILFLKQHLATLTLACAEAGFRVEETEALGALGSLPDGLLRIYVTAGDGTTESSSGKCRTFAFFEPAAFPRSEDILRGARIGIAPELRVPFLGGWKTGNYWPHVRAFAAARAKGLDEILLLDTQRVVISAAMANVFFVFGAELRTPSVCVGARRGVIREWIKQTTPVEEALLSLEDIEAADECFLTNSRLGVMPVAELEGRRLPSRSRSEALAALYREKILD
jgi:4-amino-4-deoxychorismate lyase